MKSIVQILRNFGLKDGIDIIFQKIRNKTYFKFNRKKFSLNPIIKILKSGNISAAPYPSKNVENFTNKFLDMHDANKGICVSNGTVALSVIFKACGIKYGDEIIMPAITFHSTASIALELGIIPVFVDVDYKTLCIDPNKIEEKITNKTKAIVVVHLGSIIADIDKILEICQKRNLKMIEDCSHSHGSKWKGKGVGSHGDYGFFSFQNSKLINSGEGGFITIQDENNYEKCKSYINCGRNSQPHAILGVNHRLTEIQAVLLMNSLSIFEKNLSKINFHMKYFTKELPKINYINPLEKSENQTLQTGYFFGLRLDKNKFDSEAKKLIVSELNLRGINTINFLYLPVYLNPEFGWKDSPINVDYSNTSCTVAERSIDESVFWIHHSFFNQNLSTIKYGIKTLTKILNNA